MIQFTSFDHYLAISTVFNVIEIDEKLKQNPYLEKIHQKIKLKKNDFDRRK